MTAFNPSAQFSKRWLSIPVIAKQAFHQELTDIIALLKSDTPAKDFSFHHQNFDADIAQLLRIYDNNTPAPVSPLSAQEREALEEAIYKKLSNKIDDVLSDQMAQLSEDLKAWLKTAIQEELSSYKS